jgi:hypothetical protein
MEQIGHIQWTIGIFLILAWFFDIPFSGFELIFLGVMAHFPDLVDLLWGKQGFIKYHRVGTHSIFFIGFWLLLAVISGNRFVWIIFVGSTFHIAEDILAGGGYIELFSPITRKHGRILLVTRGTQEKIGRIVKKRLSKYFLGTESLSDDLAFFWLIVMMGSWLFIIGVGLHLL